jgi:pectate lyase
MKRAFLAAGGAAVTSLLGGILVLCLCFSSNVLAAADGFGQNTTGGAGGTVETVTTAADLAYYVGIVDTPYIIQVSGVIDLNSLTDKKISIRSNKTIRGIGENPTIIGQVGFKNGSSNVIIERLNISSPSGYGEGDGISVKEDINNVFITKCTFLNCYDSCIDITRRSDWVTVSWCKFYFTHTANNDRVHLIGGGDTHDDQGKLHITFHHNWYGFQCWQRIPSVRFGRAHIYNNYYNCSNNLYCVRTRLYAECLVENNYFINVQNPWERYVSSVGVDHPGLLYAAGNVLNNVTWNVHGSGVVLIDGTDTVFTPSSSYSYTLDNAADVPAIVQNGAGADGNDILPPHWFFGPYGDFDYSGIVDINDLPQFVGYWLGTDCNAIANADYDGNCDVNFYEFSLLAGNWGYIPPDTTAPASPKGLWALGSNGTVPLDWDDNNEPDWAGYNIYRSTTSGSGYSKLNVSLLSNSDYTDNSVVNGTMYYYVATAADTSSNESGHSVEACAVPDSNTNIILQENATGFCSVDGAIENEWAGYTGTGYANTINALGNGVNWEINVPSDGNYTFVWRYALVSGNRTGKLIANGDTVVPSISFPASGAVTTYIETSPIDVNLTAGIKDIRLEATTADGLGNIDDLKITGINPQAAGCQ